jgi:hypothetical protein
MISAVGFLVVLFGCLALSACGSPINTNALRQSVNQSTPLKYQEWQGKRVMFIGAHIDDTEFSSGGLVSMLRGIAEIHILIVTNGDKGCSNDEICGNLTNAALTALRQQEQADSAKILGIPVENIYYLTYEDCQLNQYPVAQVQQEIVGYLRKIQPHIVFSFDPTPQWDLIPSQGWGDLGKMCRLSYLS